MARRSSIDAIVEEVLCELEDELEAEVGGKTAVKFPYRWWVSRRDFGSNWEIVENLSTQPEVRTPSDALTRHAAVVMMAYKTLKARGYNSGQLKVERFVDRGDGRMTLDLRDRDARGNVNSGCSIADLGGKWLEIRDCRPYL
jgi:hypothetical protein